MTYWDLDGADETDGDFDGRRGDFEEDRRCTVETGEGSGEDLDFLRSEYFPLALNTSHCSSGHSSHCQQVVEGEQSLPHFFLRQTTHNV